MRILIDTQAFSLQTHGGISRFYTELFLFIKKKVKVSFPLYYSENEHLKAYGIENFRASFFLKYKILPKRYSVEILKKKNRWRTVELLSSGKIDLFIPTYYDPYFLNYLNNTPYVLTVYDMIHEIFPEYYTYDEITVPNKRLLIEKASKIIAISQNTKNDILRFYPSIPESKIEVVYLSQSIPKLKKIKSDFKYFNEKYVLYVGNRLGYKNFIWLINNISSWLLSKNIKLLCVGAEFTKDETNLIENLGAKNYIFQCKSLDEDLFNFYKNALAFIFPSAYEGFGIPVLEAMSCGCPVVLPKLSSFPEVASEAGVYFDLDNPETLIYALNELSNNDTFRQSIIMKGYINEQKFSWKKTADECLKIYYSVIK